MFNKGIPFLIHNLFTILPRAEAAAVWINPLNFLSLNISTSPIAVRGLITPDEADCKGTS